MLQEHRMVLKKTLPGRVLPRVTFPLVVLHSVDLRQDLWAFCPRILLLEIEGMLCHELVAVGELPGSESSSNLGDGQAAGAPAPRWPLFHTCSSASVPQCVQTCGSLQRSLHVWQEWIWTQMFNYRQVARFSNLSHQDIFYNYKAHIPQPQQTKEKGDKWSYVTEKSRGLSTWISR